MSMQRSSKINVENQENKDETTPPELLNNETPTDQPIQQDKQQDNKKIKPRRIRRKDTVNLENIEGQNIETLPKKKRGLKQRLRTLSQIFKKEDTTEKVADHEKDADKQTSETSTENKIERKSDKRTNSRFLSFRKQKPKEPEDPRLQQLETHHNNVKTRLEAASHAYKERFQQKAALHKQEEAAEVRLEKSADLYAVRYMARREAEKKEAQKKLFYGRLKIGLAITGIILGAAAVASAIVFSGGFAALGGIPLIMVAGGEFAVAGILTVGFAAVAGAFVGLGVAVKSFFEKLLSSKTNVPNKKDPVVISTRAQMLEVMKQFNPEEFARKDLPKEAKPEEHALSAIAVEYQEAIRVEGATELNWVKDSSPASVNGAISKVGKFAPASKEPEWEGEAIVRDNNGKLVFESESPRPKF